MNNTNKRPTPPTEQRRRPKKKKSVGSIILGVFLKFLIVLVTTVVIIAATLFISLKMMCSDSSPAAQRMFVTTILETGQLKFLASWFLSPEEIQEIVNTNSMKEFNEEVDDTLIDVGGSGSVSIGGTGETTEEDIQVIEISGATFYANMLIVKDPSRVSIASIYPWRDQGVTLDQLVNDKLIKSCRNDSDLDVLSYYISF